jgi:hypothetical protein
VVTAISGSTVRFCKLHPAVVAERTARAGAGRAHAVVRCRPLRPPVVAPVVSGVRASVADVELTTVPLHATARSLTRHVDVREGLRRAFRGRTGVRTIRALATSATQLTRGGKRRAACRAGCEWAVLDSNQ